MFKSIRLTRVIKLLLLGALLLPAACGPPPEVKEDLPALVFPDPPEAARFVLERTLTGKSDVDAKEEYADLRKLITGDTQSAEESTFQKPFSIAVHQGRVYVSDTVTRTVSALDPAQGKLITIGKEDPGTLVKPLGMDIDNGGNLYVVDAQTKWVMVYDRDGKYLRAIGGKQYFERPSGVAVSDSGDRIYVVDTGSSRGTAENHRVRVFDGKSGSHLFDFGRRGSSDGQFNLPRDIAIGPGGKVHVLDTGNFRVQVFSPEGQFLRKFGSVGRRMGQFARPKGLAVDKEGNIYVSDASHGNFQIYTPEGQLLLFIGTRGSRPDRAQYVLPAQIDIDEDGRIYVVDQIYRKVDVYRPADLKEEDGWLGKAFKALTQTIKK